MSVLLYRLTVHKLGARTLIRSLEEGEHRGWQDTKVKKVVQLSVQSGISSSLTAFIAVFNNNGETIQGPLLHKNILKHGEFLKARTKTFTHNSEDHNYGA